MEKALYQISQKVFLKKEGKILVLRAVSDGLLNGTLDFPGGRIDENELDLPIETILKRELKEELGDIEVNLSSKPVAVSKYTFAANEKRGPINIYYVFFEAEFLGGEIKISDEHQNYEWVDLKSLNLEENFMGGILSAVKLYLS